MDPSDHSMREMLKRAVSFDNVSVFASMPSEICTFVDGSEMDPTTETYSSAAQTDGAALERTSKQPGIAVKRLCIVMVGLPARGKTHIARCLERYLNWLGMKSHVFNVGSYRRMILGGSQTAEFFDPNNEEGLRARMELAMECLTDMMRWFQQGGLVGIYDATNSTRKRRVMVKQRLESVGVRVLFLESLCTDQNIIDKNIFETKLRSPDYRDQDPELAARDFRARIRQYDRINETISDDERCSYIKVINVGRQLILNDIHGYLPGKLVSFLLNSHIMPRSIYLSRHGESEWNVTGQLGGDPGLTKMGQAYARSLAQFMQHEFTDLGKDMPQVWTSQLVRTRQTVKHIPVMNLCWRALNEIDAGICEGLTYEEVAQKYPDVARDRKRDKLTYRYPGGESYVDVIHRIEPVILEVERQTGPVLIVAHNAVIRSIYGYFMGKRQDECPYIDIPLHTVFKLTTRAYGAEVQVFKLDVASTYQNKTPESGDSDGHDDVVNEKQEENISEVTHMLRTTDVS